MADLQDHVDVLIVGGGPTGLTLACELARRGVSTRVIDRSTDFHRQSRGKGIQPRSLEILDDLGVVREFQDSATAEMPARIYTGTRFVAELHLLAGIEPRPDVPYPSLVLLPQWRTEQILRDRLASWGVRVELGLQLVGLRQSDHDVEVEVAEVATGVRRTIYTSYVVGCDGGGSTVRRCAGISFPGLVSETERYLLGDVEVDGLARDASYVWYGEDQSSVGLALLPGTNAWQFGLTVRPGEEGAGEEPSLELFQRLFEQRTGRRDVRLHDATWLSHFSYKVRLADRYRAGRVFIAGDAAHVHPIAGGLGMNTGIQDAYNLGWKLALAVQGRAPESVLDTYEQERRPVAESVLRTSGASMTALFSTKPLMTLLRDKVVLPLLRLPAVTRALVGKTSQLDVNYRKSVLSAHGKRRRGRVRAGDRAPDACLDASTGEQARLFDVFRGTHFTLLQFGAIDTEFADRIEELFGDDVHVRHVLRVSAPAAGTAARVLLGAAHRTYRASRGELILIRPDGYVALRSPRGGGDAVIKYLSTLLIETSSAAGDVRRRTGDHRGGGVGTGGGDLKAGSGVPDPAHGSFVDTTAGLRRIDANRGAFGRDAP
ncbi:FAD-dependent monooxygenase [Streptosporangium sp. NBC_01469]|uniref:FAD-dependent monooxygenase n=1 Tax=Streptosporangium sp. NBC_01469 TaxID=2903898 RepID=UPI002E295959|nr:FAD-dependent monooxygenase [Streptosporangium sp. NBC_01469]